MPATAKKTQRAKAAKAPKTAKVRKAAPAHAVRSEAKPRQALGRGLSALIAPVAGTHGAASAQGFRTLPIERVFANKDQPRKHFDAQALDELTASVRTQGVLQPIVVRRRDDGYEIVAGERRWRAAARAGLKEVPAMVKELSDVHALQVALIENIQRADLDPIEEALAYQNLLTEHKLRHEDVAEAVGKNRVTITNSLRLLKLPPEVMAMLVAGKLTPGHARALMAVESPVTMQRLAEEVIGRGLSVREVEEKARRLAKPAAKRAAKREEKQGLAASALVEQLQRSLGTKVRLLCSKRGKGQLELQFDSFMQLDELVDRLTQKR